MFASGTRNPQGLFVDEELGLVLETEHGPRGGDEINAIRPGIDYGWPKVTYGTNYTVVDDASVQDTCLTKCGDHTGYELPLFASDDFQEGMRSFLEKRPASFTGC